MSYKMLKIQFGTSVIQNLFSVETDFDISSMLYVGEFGFLFIFKNKNCIGFIDASGKSNISWLGKADEKGSSDGTSPLFCMPSSICYFAPLKSFYVLERGGTRIRAVDIGSMHTSTKMGENSSRELSRYFSKFNDIDKILTFCDVDMHGNIYWSARELNRCFKYRVDSDIVETLAGNGRSGFLVSSTALESSFSSPSGIKCVKDSVYIADAGNFCIREIRNGKTALTAGKPTIRGEEDGIGNNCLMLCPSQMKYFSNIMYFLDKNRVRYLSLSDKTVGTVYTSHNIAAIEMDNRRNLFVLEKI